MITIYGWARRVAGVTTIGMMPYPVSRWP